METEPIGNAIGVPTLDENNQVNNNRQNLFAFLFGNSDNSQNGHDTSGHCQKMIHVPAHSREGKPVNAYNRTCGRDHDEKEAQQKNQAEKVNKETLSQKETVSEKKQRKYDELIQAYWPCLKKHEGSINYAYLDTLGKVTAASGLYIPNQKTFISLPWMYQGKEATTEQKLGEYKRLLDFQKQKIFGKNYTSEDFRVTNHSQELTLSEHTIIDKTMEHLGNDLAELESKFPAFETYPRTLQMVLLDMQYNMGHNFNSEKWHFFFEGVNKKNVFQMINEVNRYQVGKTRNDWARNTLREIPLINGWFYSPCKYRNK